MSEQTAYPAMPIRLYLIRHGQTEYNVRHIAQGRCESPLTEEGVSQAESLGHSLKSIPFEAAYSGDQGRQMDTAHIVIRKNVNAPTLRLRILGGLDELCYGSFEGKPEEEMLAPVYEQAGVPYGDFSALSARIGHSGLVDAVAQNDPNHEAEWYQQGFDRIYDTVLQIAQQAESEHAQNVLVASSGGIIGVLLSSLFPELRASGRDLSLPNCSVVVLSYDGTKLHLSSYGGN